MKIKPYSPKKGVKCFVKFQGCEPDIVNRHEQRDVISASVLNREPCQAWDASGISNGATVYEPGDTNSKNILKNIIKGDLTPRARRLALEMHTCHIDVELNNLTHEFTATKIWRDDCPPFVSVEGVANIFPQLLGVSNLTRRGLFSYTVECDKNDEEHAFHQLNHAIQYAASIAIQEVVQRRINQS